MSPADRKTPAPSPGEWVPTDLTFTKWVLSCSVCGGKSDEHVAPLSYLENKRARQTFLEEHAACREKLSSAEPR